MQLACRQPTYRKRNVAVYAPPSVFEATERHVYIRIHGINGWRHMATYLGEKYKSRHYQGQSYQQEDRFTNCTSISIEKRG